jgi:hypothetical protein
MIRRLLHYLHSITVACGRTEGEASRGPGGRGAMTPGPLHASRKYIGGIGGLRDMEKICGSIAGAN